MFSVVYSIEVMRDQIISADVRETFVDGLLYPPRAMRVDIMLKVNID